jgi:tRNA threonylcarbamoyladenosine biosynthesis protein TsaB
MAEIILTLDTSTVAGSVALTRGQVLLGEILINVRGNHTDRLLCSVEQLLRDVGVDLAEVDAFAVVLGPGSFTGLRVGTATAKGFAMAQGKPLLGISSLRGLALQVPFARHPVCALLDARKKEVYAGWFCWEGGMPVSLRPEAALLPEQVVDGLEGETIFIGDGSVAYQTLIIRRLGSRAHFVPWPLNPPRASVCAVLALHDLREGRTIPAEQLAPAYIRPSEAEIMWTRRSGEGSIEG